MAENIYDMTEDNKLDEIKREIENGVNLNKKNEFGWTPLHLSISRENEEMALLLLEHGANAGVQDNDGLTALHYAAEYDSLEVAKAILEATPETLHIENKYGEQPLWRAVQKSKEPDLMVKLFLKYGANKDYGKEGSTPFDMAIKFNDEEFTKLFKDY